MLSMSFLLKTKQLVNNGGFGRDLWLIFCETYRNIKKQFLRPLRFSLHPLCLQELIWFPWFFLSNDNIHAAGKLRQIFRIFFRVCLYVLYQNLQLPRNLCQIVHQILHVDRKSLLGQQRECVNAPGISSNDKSISNASSCNL